MLVEVTITTLGLGVVVSGGTKVVDGGIEIEEVIVVGSLVGTDDVGGIEELSVTVTVVEKEVVRLIEVWVMIVVLIESVAVLLVLVAVVSVRLVVSVVSGRALAYSKKKVVNLLYLTTS